ncbi:hypothetical protein CANCADRAFT_117626 [Tortispora caseinolytica NRRL Y-17796]|uniref:DUF1446-domain-containing protein n=1 Tax=Tortispora caseinolytica NRRL Y-17796 TaxID=767744 RepID=A0A1E4THE2_9ASCO|nr:hypothetical protein CANCADRAFT_117626 [Tortispora caseinolytica NRRL Y-17796]
MTIEETGKRPCRIAGASGSVTDTRKAMADIAKNDKVDFIIGDWMSEYNMTSDAYKKVNDPNADCFEATFLEAFEPAIADLDKNGIKIAVDAGASDTKKLAEKVMELLKKYGSSMKVAWVEGDEVWDVVDSAMRAGHEFTNLSTGEKLSKWDFKPFYAQCYLGGFGIAEALRNGADIVICGRVADASPVIGCSIYWHNWSRDDLHQLAHSFVAGHLIECSTYVTGGNYAGFKELMKHGLFENIGFPIAEISSSGEFVITKQENTNGMVSVDTCTAQLVYEIQGPLYYNSDVCVDLRNLKFEQLGPNRVKVSGAVALPPPPTTKVGLSALGGYQAELHYFFVGLDIEEKAALVESQVRQILDVEKFHCLKFQTWGSVEPNPHNQNAATVDFRIFAQAKRKEDISESKFFRPISDTIMSTYPGATFHTDFRTAIPKPYMEYFVTIMSQSDVKHRVQLPFAGKSIDIPPPEKTEPFVEFQPSSETANPADLASFGPTETVPIGFRVLGRSGDKGSDANVGLWVRTDDEYEWLRSLLTVEKIKDLLGPDEYKGKRIDRFEIPNLRAVHFLLKDHLDRGISSTSSYDFLAKNVAEYIRSKHVDMPVRFLQRGRV